ncbi:MAG: hypothetical protein Q9212_004157 [Teloschistes hypoglaucus]
MHFSSWIIAAGLLRFLPSSTASPLPAAPKPAASPKQSATNASDACSSSPSPGAMSPECWASLDMNDFLTNWTTTTVIGNAPMIGTIYCKPKEIWAQCFLRFAYGQQRQPAAPMDCSTPTSKSCKSPFDVPADPTSPEYYYGAYSIFAVFAYITAIASALLSVTAYPGALQSAYTSAYAGAGAASAPNPVDATLFELLSQSGFSAMDTAFVTYMNKNSYTGGFVGASTDPPSDAVIYTSLVAVLQQRLKGIMTADGAFQSLVGTKGVWIAQVPPAASYVKAWTTPGEAASAVAR